MTDKSVQSVIDSVQRQFLCCVPLRDFQWSSLFECMTWDDQAALIGQTVNLELVLRRPLRIAYQKSFLKCIIQKLEQGSVEVHDDVYAAFGRVMALGDQAAFKHYCIGGGKFISLKETPHLISKGTTGLRTWQAALALAEWCVANKPLLQNKTILELGSGVGLTGLTAALLCHPRKVYLTDCHPSVLQVLCQNVQLNVNPGAALLQGSALFREALESQTKVEVLNLPWEEISQDVCGKTNPELLLAADVIYDSSLFPSLINGLSLFLRQANTKELIVACTVRNEGTLKDFLQQIGPKGLIYTELKLPPQNTFIWSTTSLIQLYSIKKKR